MGYGRYRDRCRGKAVVMTAEIIPEITAAIVALITAVMTYLMISTISAVIEVAMNALKKLKL